MEDCSFTHLSYGETGFFSKTVDAYIGNDERLRPFYKYPVSAEGLADAVRERESFPIDRGLLVQELISQYETITITDSVRANINWLAEEKTFTVCTAHQPAIFTGNLYFIYKILHTIRLAEELSVVFPGNRFVPVYYMGCEDADLDELGNIFLEGERLVWKTVQTGAIGRMNLKGLDEIVHRVDGALSVLPHGKELMQLLNENYLDAPDIQTATLKLINRLFGEYGLVVLIPDRRRLKEVMIPVFEEELLRQTSAGIVEKTISALGEHFKVQASPRPINLFYQKDDIRERIERINDEWKVVNTDLVFDRNTLLKELHAYPERFSPNVILRGILQETILPNIAFIGGGGELAYWLELKDVFDHHRVAYPVLILRNSFLLIEGKWKAKMDKLGISVADIFINEQTLLNELVKRESKKQLTISGEITNVATYYDRLKNVARQVDSTLTGHVAALQTKAIRPLHELQKKMIRAEKRRFEIEQRQLSAIKKALFPNNGLQERVENFMPYYAKWGQEFIKMIYDHSLTIEQKFVVMVVK